MLAVFFFYHYSLFAMHSALGRAQMQTYARASCKGNAVEPVHPSRRGRMAARGHLLRVGWEYCGGIGCSGAGQRAQRVAIAWDTCRRHLTCVAGTACLVTHR
jgi:hypothetical protein